MCCPCVSWYTHMLIPYWECVDTLLGVCWYPTGSVLIPYWECVDTLLGVCSYHTGSVLILYWECVDTLLGVCWYPSGSVLITYWECVDTLLGVCWYSTGSVLIPYWECVHTLLGVCSYPTGTISVVSISNISCMSHWPVSYYCKLYITTLYVCNMQTWDVFPHFITNSKIYSQQFKYMNEMNCSYDRSIW